MMGVWGLIFGLAPLLLLAAHIITSFFGGQVQLLLAQYPMVIFFALCLCALFSIVLGLISLIKKPKKAGRKKHPVISVLAMLLGLSWVAAFIFFFFT